MASLSLKRLFTEADRLALANGQAVRCEIELQRADGMPVYISGTVQAIRSLEGHRLACTVLYDVDVTPFRY